MTVSVTVCSTSAPKALLAVASTTKPAKAVRRAVRRGLGLLKQFRWATCFGGCSGMVLEEEDDVVMIS